MSGPEGSHLKKAERAPKVAFKLNESEERDFLENQGVVLKSKNVDKARLHNIIRVQGAKKTYEAEVVAIQDPSSNAEGHANYVVSFVRTLEDPKPETEQ